MSKHTPGPLCYDFHGGYIFKGKLDDVKGMVGEVYCKETGPINEVIGRTRWNGGNISNEEERANGNLFAAAPNMHEALEDVKSYLEFYILDENGDADANPEGRRVHGEITKVLAKADGEHE